MSRSTAREHLFQLTFEQLFSEDKNDVTLEAYLMDASLTDSDKLYVRKAYDGIYTHLDELKGIVAKYSNGFNIDRIYKPDLAAMIVSVYEMKYVPEVPPPSVSTRRSNLSKNIPRKRANLTSTACLQASIRR